MLHQIHVSAVMDPRSVTVTGDRESLQALYEHGKELQLIVQGWPLKGKYHCSANTQQARELSRWCSEYAEFQLPSAQVLQVPIRSNRTGDVLSHGPLAEECIFASLTSRCEWYSVLRGVARDLKSTSTLPHVVVTFGVGDCVSMAAFQELGLQVTKVDGFRMFARNVRHDSMTEPHREEAPANLGRGDCSDNNPIAIVGLSLRLPGANNLEELWELISERIDCHREIDATRFDLFNSFRASQASENLTRKKFFANFVENVETFDHAFFGISAREAVNMDPQQRILLELAYEAVESSGYLRHPRRETSPVACFIGACAVDYLENTSAHNPTAYTSTGTLRSFLSGKISHYFGWSGPSEVIDTACSSSMVAIHRACQALQHEGCSMALAGGISIMTSGSNFLDLGRAGFLSHSGQCKPFDQAADGYCRADGAGLVVLKPLRQAELDGDQIFGLIPATATNQGASSSSLVVPQVSTLASLYRSTLRKAGQEAQQISYVEAHGTGTQVGDCIEMQSVREVFGGNSRFKMLHIGSIKGNIGHCEAAAGVAGLLKVIAMLEKRCIPPQASHHTLNPKIPSLDPSRMAIAKKRISWSDQHLTAFVNSYGASGSNSALIVGAGPRTKQYRHQQCLSQKGLTYPVLLSAATKSSLVSQNEKLALHLSSEEQEPDIADLAYTLWERRARHKYRTILTASDTEGLINCLNKGEHTVIEAPRIVKKVVLVFGGQSKQAVGLSWELYERYSHFQTHLKSCNEILIGLRYPPIIPAVFQAEPIRNPVVLHTAMVATQLAFAQCWIESGLKIEGIVGHSLGELAALGTSGVLSWSDCLKLVAYRAHLIKSRWGADEGAMLLVRADLQQVEALKTQVNNKESYDVKVEIACYNGNSSYVLVGTKASIIEAEQVLKTIEPFRGTRCCQLDVSHGFHSQLMTPILEDLESLSKSLDWRPSHYPLHVCRESEPQSVPPYSPSRHAREPVWFMHAVQRIEQRLGSCTWLEVGMNTPSISITEQAVAHFQQHSFVSLSKRDGRAATDAVTEAVMHLWSIGVEINHWVTLNPEGLAPRQIWLPPYSFDKNSHWVPNIDRAAELRDKRNDVSASPPPPVAETSPQLVTMTMESLHQAGATPKDFQVNTSCDRFTKMCRGHQVCGRPIAPGSLYMECAAMAVQILLKSTRIENLSFRRMKYHGPLSLDADRHVFLTLEPFEKQNAWNLAIKSSDQSHEHHSESLHATGELTANVHPELEALQRLSADKLNQFEPSQEVETLLPGRAYRLFDSVVQYGALFKGIRRISIGPHEATAEVRLPEYQPEVESSTARSICDAVTIEMLMQPLGLLVNSSDMITQDEVFVGAGLDASVFSSACKLDSDEPWTVFAKCNALGNSQTVGDVLVFTARGDLVGMLTGCRFSRTTKSRLERALSLSNPKPASNPKTSTNPTSQSNISPSVAHVAPVTDSVIKGKSAIDDGPWSTSSASQDGRGMAKQDSKGCTGGASQNVLPNGQSNAPQSHHAFEDFRRLLCDYSGAPKDSVVASAFLSDLGIDSLASLELKEELEQTFGSSLEHSMITADQRVGDIMSYLKITSPAEESGSNVEASLSQASSNSVSDSAPTEATSVGSTSSMCSLPNLNDELVSINAKFEVATEENGSRNYWSDVADDQQKLLLAYLDEAFRALGVDLQSIPKGHELPQIPHKPKYHRIMERFLAILQSSGILETRDGRLVRTHKSLYVQPSHNVYEWFVQKHPSYSSEANVMDLMGPRLADCLAGKSDPMDCLFGSAASWRSMEEFYESGPILATVTAQLVLFLRNWISGLASQGRKTPLKILEVGAGTGGTTKKLVASLCELGISVQYTFSDISMSLIRKAKRSFAHLDWMDFETFDLEQDPPSHLKERFDIVLATNTIHATSDRSEVLRRLHTTLVDTGFTVISETTRVVDWCDLVFGLLDGWWIAEGGSVYTFQSADVWMDYFRAAGYKGVCCSGGDSKESTTQQLILGCKDDKFWAAPSSVPQRDAVPRWRLQTMVYKKVDTIEISADVYLPRLAPQERMPIGESPS